MLRQPPPAVTNTAFLAAIFHDTSAGGQPVICSILGDPQHAAWIAQPAGIAKAWCPSDRNNYFNCSSFHPLDDGEIRATKARFAACHVIVLDDVGTKVPLERVEEFPFSFKLETSPGNFQVGIILDRVIKDPQLASRLQQALIDAGLSDPGATNPGTRWMRLPEGINGKNKHQVAGKPFPCKLREWHPDRRYSVEDLLSSFGLTLPAPRLEAPADDDSEQAGHSSIGLAQLAALVNALDPDASYQEWLSILMVIHHETGGSAEGLDFADRWSARGSKYGGRSEIEAKWHSFRHGSSRPLTVATLFHMLREQGQCAEDILAATEPQFEVCETIIVAGTESKPAPAAAHPLAKYSVRHHLAELESEMVEQKPLLGDIILQGQASVIYAAPNTGKTLVTLAQTLDAIEKGHVRPSNVFYVNMDDNGSGLVQKTRFAKEYGFEMLADGHQGFRARVLLQVLEDLIERDAARGTVVILDTLKKFVNVMEKGLSSEFAKLARRFVMKGGTLVALAHTNKRPDDKGNPIPGGTSDILDDFDAGFTLKKLPAEPGARECIVQFDRLKSRGSVPDQVAYSYSTDKTASYAELVLSVRRMDPEDFDVAAREAEARADAPVVNAIKDCIREGCDLKMDILRAVRKHTDVPKRAVEQILKKYTGSDPTRHHWRVVSIARGGLQHFLLEGAKTH